MNLLITGGAGFIGSNFIRYWFNKYPGDKIVNLDSLTYAGVLSSLEDQNDNNRYKFVKGNINNFENTVKLLKDEKIDTVINFTAESHVGRALLEPGIFVKTNVMGIQVLLEAMREVGIKKFYHVSSVEVYGDLELDSDYAFREEDPYKPKTLYNASKACSNIQIMAYFHTYGIPVIIGHCSNNYGPYQFPEKVVPRFITNAIDNKDLPLFKSSDNKREWLHVDDHCRAIDMLIKKGQPGEAYNIGSGVEKSIEEIADIILTKLNRPKKLKTYVEDRPCHDKRYLMNTDKIQNAIGWEPEYDFEKGMEDVIEWYLNNEKWWRPLVGKGYVENYKKV